MATKKRKVEFEPSTPDIGAIFDALFVAKELPLANIPTNLEVYQLYLHHVTFDNTADTKNLVAELLEKKEN